METETENKFEKKIVWWNSIHGGKREKNFPVGINEEGKLIAMVYGHKREIVSCQDGTYTF